MTKFEIAFETDNAAFDDMPELEVSRILNEIAEKVSHGTISGLIRDYNGNTIGAFASRPCDDISHLRKLAEVQNS